MMIMMMMIFRLCRREAPDYAAASGQPHYSVAISNSLFKETANG